MTSLGAGEDSTSHLEIVKPRTLWSILTRDLLLTLSYRLAFFFDLVFGMVSLFIYYFISETIGGPTAIDLGAAPTYFDFAAVGAVITLVIQAASTAMARRIREEQLTGTLEALLMHPVSSSEIAVGFAAFPFLFATLRAFLYLVVGGAFLGLALSDASWAGFAVMIVVAGIALSAIGVMLGALTLVVKRGGAFAPLATLALGLGGGAFFPIEVLPGWLEPVARVLPTRFVFDGVRTALFDARGWGGDAMAVFVFAAVAAPLSLFLFAAAVRATIRGGTLGQY